MLAALTTATLCAAPVLLKHVKQGWPFVPHESCRFLSLLGGSPTAW